MPLRSFVVPAAAGLAISVVSIAAPVFAQQETAPSTLPELIVSAVATNESVGRADSQVRRSDADIRLASSVLLPSLDLSGSWVRYKDEQAIELTPGESFVIRPSTDWVWSADLSQTLFSGLRDWRARDIAKLNRDIAMLQRSTVINDLTLEVAAAFYNAVAARERVEVERVAVEAISSQLQVAERRFEVGEVTVADVARWRAEVAAEKQRLVVAEGDAEIARRRLARLAGVAEVGTLVTPGPIPAPPADDAALRAKALSTRLEMTTLRNQLEAAGLFVKVERGGWLPELDANMQYLQQKSEFPSDSWLSLSLNLRVPVYDGGLTAARVAKAKEDLREVELLEQEIRKAISDQVDVAAVTYRAATAALEAAEQRLAAAREAYRQVERAYRVGEVTALDLLDATSEATDAENSHIIARAQREYQSIALRHAIGVPPLPDLDLVSTPSEEHAP